jgi:hypothetical protein
MKGATIRTVSLPWHVEKGGTSDEDETDAHAFEIIEMIDESFEVTAISKLSLSPVCLVHRLEVIVVTRISISEFIEKDGVCRQGTPVLG